MKTLLFILMTVGLLFAEVNEKDILLKEANRYSLRRQYDKAISIYSDLQQQYPQDSEIAEKLIENYLYTNRLDEADQILTDNSDIFSDTDFTRLKLSILLANSKVTEAVRITDDFFTHNAGKINNYKMIASVFQRYRQYDQAIDILSAGREISQDEYLFANEMANNYYQTKDYSNAIQEYLKHVEKNKAYNNYVQNKIKIILREDSLQISSVRDFTVAKGNDIITEIYAISLGAIGNIDEALKVYNELDPDKLLKFADTLNKSGDIINSTRAYENYKNKVASPELLADVDIKIAESYLQLKNFESAEQILLEIYSNKQIKDKKMRFKTKANRKCREMLSDLALLRNEYDRVVPYLEEAMDFTYNQNEKQELNFKIIHFNIMITEYSKAEKKLNEILIKEDPASNIYKKGYYFKYLLSIMDNNVGSDSLLSELLINIPEDKEVNDAIQLSLILQELDKNAQEDFLSAFRKKRIFEVSEAVEILEAVYSQTENEKLLILAGEWALYSGDKEKAQDIFNSEFLDEDFGQYALLQAAQINSGDYDWILRSEEFLRQNPKSVFSPGFRKIIAGK